MKKSIVTAAFLLSLAGPLSAQNPEDVASGPTSTRPGDKGYTAAYVIEPSSGRVLFEDNANAPVPTASMVKMMTCLIVMEKIRDGRLKLDGVRAGIYGGIY